MITRIVPMRFAPPLPESSGSGSLVCMDDFSCEEKSGSENTAYSDYVDIPVNPPSTVIDRSPRVLIALPWQKQVNPMTAFCVSQLIDRRRTASLLHYGDAFVTHSRNSCADAFLKSKCTWMLMIDDDMIVPFGNAKWYQAHTQFNVPEKFAGMDALDRLLSHGKTVVGALYFGRSPGARAVYNESANDRELAFARSGPHDLIKPTRWVGTGCFLVHRVVFEAIEKRFPALARNSKGTGGQWFTSTEASLMQRLNALRDYLTNGAMTGEKAFGALEKVEAMLAEAKRENPLATGEDVSFCLRAAAAGHQPYVDLGLRCGHLGTRIY